MEKSRIRDKHPGFATLVQRRATGISLISGFEISARLCTLEERRHQLDMTQTFTILKGVIERLDQGLSSRRATCRTTNGHGRGANLRTPAPQAATLPKELSRQLISWLFGTSTWPEAGAAFGPLHGRPSACGVTHGLKTGK
jgi:hypothetical protein